MAGKTLLELAESSLAVSPHSPYPERTVRKMLSAILLVMFGLLTVSPVFALGMESASKLPACCRRAGAHKCAGGMEHTGAFADNSGPVRVHTAWAKCPYCPLASAASHTDSIAMTPARSALAMPVSRLSVAVQTGCPRSQVRDRSRHKRGPPSFLLA